MIHTQNLNRELSSQEIAELAPSVFTSKKSIETSDKYTHIPTTKVIDDMKLLGWKVVGANQVKARSKGTIGFQKHLLIFGNDDVVVEGNDGDTVFPQIILTNSHDGKNSFQFQAGLYRLVCSNGLVISDKEFGKIKIRHMGYTFEDLQVKIKEMVEKLPLTVESMNKMKKMELNEKEIFEFAKKALTTRFKEERIKSMNINFLDLVKPTRNEDMGNDVWSVFNVIQEKIISGDFEYINGSKVRKARQVKNFKQDQRINKELFDLALEYVK